MMQGDTPENPAVPAEEPSAIVRNLGMIKAASVIMGILIIILGAVVIATVVSRLSQKAAPEATLSVTIPDGMRVLSASADDDGLTLLIEGPSGSEIWRLTPSGERYQTITLVAE
jgi:hypothetical protein